MKILAIVIVSLALIGSTSCVWQGGIDSKGMHISGALGGGNANAEEGTVEGATLSVPGLAGIAAVVKGLTDLGGRAMNGLLPGATTHTHAKDDEES